MRYNRINVYATAVALIILLVSHNGIAQNSTKDTLNTFLFEFINMPQNPSTAYISGVVEKVNRGLNRKGCTIDNQIMLFIAGSEAHLKNKNIRKANDFLDKADNLARKQSNKKLQARILLEQSKLNRFSFKKEQAIESIQQAIAMARSAGDEGIEAEAYLQLGLQFRAEGNTKQALTAYEEGISLAKKNNTNSLLITGLGYRAAAYRDLSNKVEALTDANTALAFASKLNSPLQASIANIKGSIYYRFGEFDLALQSYRKGQQHLTKLAFSQDFGATLQENIALCLKEKQQFSLAKATLDSAQKVRRNLPDTTALAKNYTQQGNLALSMGRYADALEQYLLALQLRQQAGNPSEIAASQTNIGLLYRSIGLNSKAIVYLKDALEHQIANGTDLDAGESYTHLGNAYFDTKKFKEALECYKKALDYRKDAKDKSLEARSLNSIATVYQELKRYDKAEAYFLDALETNAPAEIKGQAIIYNNLGNFYITTNNKKKALSSFYKSLQLNKTTQNTLGQGLALRKIGEVYLDLKDYSKADSCLKASLQVGSVGGNLEHLKNTNLALYRLCFEKKDFAKALSYYIIYSQFKDSIIKTKSSEELINARLSVEIEKKKSDITRIENEVIVLRKETQLQESERKRQTYILIFLIASSLLLVILGGVLYRAYHLKKQKAALLQEKYSLTQEANKQLAESEKNLQKLNATKDKFFSIIAHDLKSPFNALLGFTELLKSRATALSPEEVYEYGSTIHSSSERLYALLENLLQWARTQTGRIPFNPTTFNLNEVILKNLHIQELAANNKNIAVEVESIEEFRVEADIEMVNTIMRNLLSNAIKFTPSGGSIIVSTAAKDNFAAVRITDTGSGMTPDDLSLLFRLDVHFTTKGTGNETGTGLGLIICKEFVEQNKGEIIVSSQVGKGTTFTFTLPISKA